MAPKLFGLRILSTLKNDWGLQRAFVFAECVDYIGNSVSQLTSHCYLKLAEYIVRVFIPWKLANATNHGFFFFF